MNVLDYIILLLLVAGVVRGLFKGLLKQVLTVASILVVVLLTATFTPYTQKWLSSVIENENTRSVIAMLTAALLLGIACALVSALIRRLLTSVSVLKTADRLLGGVLGLAVVYMIFAVLFSLFNSTGEEFLPLLKRVVGETFATSWFANTIYANNFFGDWVVVGIAQKMLDSISPAEEAVLAIVHLFVR